MKASTKGKRKDCSGIDEVLTSYLISTVFNCHPLQEQNGSPSAKMGKLYIVVKEKNEVRYLVFQDNLFNHYQEMEDVIEVADYFNADMEDLVSNLFAVFIVFNKVI